MVFLFQQGYGYILLSSCYSSILNLEWELRCKHPDILVFAVMFVVNQDFTFVSHVLPMKKGAKETGREHSWGRWPKVAKGIFHSIERHAQYINWGELPGWMVDLDLGRGVWHLSMGGEQLHCASLISSFSIIIIIIIYNCYHTLIIELCVVLNFHLGLNPNRWNGSTIQSWTRTNLSDGFPADVVLLQGVYSD